MRGSLTGAPFGHQGRHFQIGEVLHPQPCRAGADMDRRQLAESKTVSPSSATNFLLNATNTRTAQTTLNGSAVAGKGLQITDSRDLGVTTSGTPSIRAMRSEDMWRPVAARPSRYSAESCAQVARLCPLV